MSDPRSNEPYRRINLQSAVARAATASTAGSNAITLWTWLAAIAAAAVIAALVFALTRSDLLQSQSDEPVTSGSAVHEPPAPVPASAPRLGDEPSAPATATPAEDR